jgi:hypothetical protein
VKEWYGVLNGVEEQVKVELEAEIVPDVPCGISVSATDRANASDCTVFNGAKVMVDVTVEGWWASIQDACTRTFVFMYWRKVLSERSKRREKKSAIMFVIPGAKLDIKEHDKALHCWSKQCNR